MVCKYRWGYFFLELVIESNTTPQNRLVRWGLPPLINTLSDHHLSDVRLLTLLKIQGACEQSLGIKSNFYRVRNTQMDLQRMGLAQPI